jgi:hypothetical protein
MAIALFKRNLRKLVPRIIDLGRNLRVVKGPGCRCKRLENVLGKEWAAIV